MNEKRAIKPSDVSEHLDTSLAGAVSNARRIAKNILTEEFDEIVVNFLIMTGVKLALNGRYTKAEVQTIVDSALASIPDAEA